MEIRHLKLIKEVAERGSLTKAQEALYLSQSALSHQLKEVETQLDTPLFHRINKKLVLTGAGKIVLESAEKILEELDHAKISVKKYVSGDSGTIRMTTQCYTCYHWLPALMRDFNKEFPKIEVEIFADDNDHTEKQLLNGRLDLAIMNEKRSYPHLRHFELFEDERVALVPTDHPWSTKKFLTAQDFAQENLIIHSYPLNTVEVIRDVLQPAGVMPKKIMQIQVTEAVIEMIKAGMGVKVMAKWMADPHLSDGALTAIPITKEGLHTKWHAVILDKPQIPQYLINFIEHLKCNIGGICPIR